MGDGRFVQKIREGIDYEIPAKNDFNQCDDYGIACNVCSFLCWMQRWRRLFRWFVIRNA